MAASFLNSEGDHLHRLFLDRAINIINCKPACNIEILSPLKFVQQHSPVNTSKGFQPALVKSTSQFEKKERRLYMSKIIISRSD
jgi:hypothetical protein